MTKKNKDTEEIKDSDKTTKESNNPTNSEERESKENTSEVNSESEDVNVEATDNTGEELSKEEKLQIELDAKNDKYLRLFAEFENYKRRTSKERIELFKTASQEVMQSLLPVLDDFDRALNEIRKSSDKTVSEGIELIHNKLRETLYSKGLEEMNVKSGDNFDSDLHEAITQVPAPSEDLKGKIIDVVEKGYTLGEKIIRFPKVVTGK
ncbi:nucleotide exchange factor GrpE [Psychroflexus aestuariivivens]|uniref:nucleotide exchange factor GrpE n=1 Tax=Psychroflexus aestuariivivens TaxID=1795040 RepID=UPI000FD74814|nr:nucleotide exchange factor GrpE [Psychroflexus aestuariivivens]